MTASNGDKVTAVEYRPLKGASVFLSASIPDPRRWAGSFDPLEITDAVVAVSREMLFAGARLVTATHPTIAPLVFYVGSEVLGPSVRQQVIVYQSEVFGTILPRATLRFEEEGVGRLIRTRAVGDEPADPQRAPRSLELMRRQMITETQPDAAVFVGGMAGISAEYDLFRELRGDRPAYVIAHPGGAALDLVQRADEGLVALDGVVYPAVARQIVSDLLGRH